MPIFTAAFFINAAITAATSLFQKHQQNKRQAEAQNAAAARNISIRASGSGHDAGIAYGYCVVQGINVHTSIGPSIPAHATAYVGAIGGMPNSADGRSSINLSGFNVNAYKGTGSFGGVLGDDRDAQQLELFVLSAGELTELVDVWLNDKSMKSDYSVANVSLAKMYPPGTYPEMAAIFVPGTDDGRRITSNDKFLGKTHMTLLTWQNSNDPQFGAGASTPTCFVRGRSLNHIRRTGTAGNYTYTYGTPSFTNAMAVVRLDYLLQENLYGPRLSVDDIHLPSWYDAQQRSSQRLIDFRNTVAPGVKTEDGELVPDPAYVTTYENIPRLGNSNFKQTGAIEGYPSQGTRGAVFSELTTKVNRRYEYNGVVPTRTSYLEVRNQMLECCPGAIEFPDHEGKLRLSIPDPYNTAADQSIGEFNDDSLIKDTLQIHLPSNATKCNKLTISFTDAELDGASSDAVFPASGSPLETMLLALGQRNKVLHQTLQLEGVADHQHAYSIAASLCLTSRRRTYTFSSGYSHMDFCEGDVVRLRHTKLAVDEYVRIIAKNPRPTMIDWEGISFHHTDYGFYPEADRQVLLPPRLNDELPVPTNVRAENDESINTTTIQWDMESSINWYATEIQHRIRGKTDWNTIAFVPKSEGTQAEHVVEAGKWTHRYRVRSIGITGGFSEWVVSANLVTTNASTIIEQIPLGTCPPRGRGAESQLWVSVTEESTSQFVKGPEPFAPPNTDDDTPADGLEGQGKVWYNGRRHDIDGRDPVSTLHFNEGRDIRPKLPASLVPEGETAYLDTLKWNRTTKRFTLRLSATSDGTTPGNNRSFASNLAGDLTIGFRSGLDLYYFTKVPFGPNASGPYSWEPEDVEAADAFFNIVHAPLAILYRSSRRCQDDPNNPWVPLAELDVFDEEIIYASSEEDTLAANQMPLNSWTYQQVAASNGIIRNGVRWDTTLEKTKYSLAREYGWTSRRNAVKQQAAGTHVADEWETRLTNHFGIKQSFGQISRREYSVPIPAARRADSDLETKVRAGTDLDSTNKGHGRWFFKKGNTRIFDNWEDIKGADTLIISPNDRHNWPVLERERLIREDRLIFEPVSSQWQVYRILGVSSDFGSIRLEATDTKSDGEGLPVSGANDFYFSKAQLTEKSAPLESHFGFNYGLELDSAGDYSFYTGRNQSGTLTGKLQGTTLNFQDVVNRAKYVALNYRDSGGNEGVKQVLDLIETEKRLPITFELDDDTFASWRIASVDTDNSLYGVVELGKLLAYRIPDTEVRFATTAESLFRFPTIRPPGLDPTFTFTFRPIPDVDEGTTSVPYSAEVTGTAKGAVGFSSRPRLSALDVGTPLRERGYSVSFPIITGKIVRGNITLPREIPADQDLVLRANAFRGTGRDKYSDDDSVSFKHKNTVIQPIGVGILVGGSATVRENGPWAQIDISAFPRNIEGNATFFWQRYSFTQRKWLSHFDAQDPNQFGNHHQQIRLRFRYTASRGVSFNIRTRVFIKVDGEASPTNYDAFNERTVTITQQAEASGGSDPHRPQRQQTAVPISLKVGERASLEFYEETGLDVLPAASQTAIEVQENAGAKFTVVALAAGSTSIAVNSGNTLLDTIPVTVAAADSDSMLKLTLDAIPDLDAGGDSAALSDRVEGTVVGDVQRSFSTTLGTISNDPNFRGTEQNGTGNRARLHPPLSVASRTQGTVTETLTRRGEVRIQSRTFNVDPTPAAEFSASFSSPPSSYASGSTTQVPSISLTGTGIATHTANPILFATDTGWFSASATPTDAERQAAEQEYLAADNDSRPYLNISRESVAGSGTLTATSRVDTTARKYFYELSHGFSVEKGTLDVSWRTSPIQQEGDVVQLTTHADLSISGTLGVESSGSWQFEILTDDGGFLSASQTTAGTSVSSALGRPYWHIPAGEQEVDIRAVFSQRAVVSLNPRITVDMSASAILRASVVASDLRPTLAGLPLEVDENSAGVALTIGSTGGNTTLPKTYSVSVDIGNFGASRGGTTRTATGTSATWWPPQEVVQDTVANFVVEVDQGPVERTAAFNSLVKPVVVPPTFMVALASVFADGKRRLSYTPSGTAEGDIAGNWSVGEGFALSTEDENPAGNTERTSAAPMPYLWALDKTKTHAVVTFLGRRQGIWTNAELTIAVAPPAPPTELAATGGFRTMSLTWTKAQVTEGYQVRYKVASADDSTYSAWQEVGDVDSYELALDTERDNTSHTVQVRGNNEFGPSTTAASVSATTLRYPPALGPGTNRFRFPVWMYTTPPSRPSRNTATILYGQTVQQPVSIPSMYRVATRSGGTIARRNLAFYWFGFANTQTVTGPIAGYGRSGSYTSFSDDWSSDGHLRDRRLLFQYTKPDSPDLTPVVRFYYGYDQETGNRVVTPSTAIADILAARPNRPGFAATPTMQFHIVPQEVEVVRLFAANNQVAKTRTTTGRTYVTAFNESSFSANPSWTGNVVDPAMPPSWFSALNNTIGLPAPTSTWVDVSRFELGLSSNEQTLTLVLGLKYGTTDLGSVTVAQGKKLRLELSDGTYTETHDYTGTIQLTAPGASARVFSASATPAERTAVRNLFGSSGHMTLKLRLLDA